MKEESLWDKYEGSLYVDLFKCFDTHSGKIKGLIYMIQVFLDNKFDGPV